MKRYLIQQALTYITITKQQHDRWVGRMRQGAATSSTSSLLGRPMPHENIIIIFHLLFMNY
jgi:hypothetical protein